MRRARHWAAVAAACLVLTAASESTAQGVLRFQAPVYKTKVGKAGTTYTPLKLSKGRFELTVQLHDGPAGALLHDETLGYTVKSDEASAPVDAELTVASKIAGAVDVVLGGDPADPLPPGLATADVWFSTQVTLFNKKGVANTYEVSPAQPLGLSGYTRGLDLAPRSLDVDEQVRTDSLVVTSDAVEGYVLTSDAAGVATWQPADVAINAIGSEQILDESLAAIDLAADSVGASEIANDAVGSTELADGAVVASKLAGGAVIASKLAADSVTSSKIADGAVGAAAIANGAVGTGELADDAVVASKLAPDSVTFSALAPSSVGGDQLLNGAVISSKIAVGAVGSSAIANSAVGTGELANDAVTSTKLASDAVTSSAIDSNAVASSHIIDGAVRSEDIAAGAVQPDDIGLGAVTGSKLATDAVTSAKIDDGSLNGKDISTSSELIYHALYAGSTNMQQFVFMGIDSDFAVNGQDVLELKVPSDAHEFTQFLEANVGLNTRFRLDADGDAFCDGSWNGGGADYADLVRVAPRADTVEPGDVLVIDPHAARRVSLSTTARSTLVAGVYSTRPAFVGWGDREADLPHPEEALFAAAGAPRPERIPIDAASTAVLWDEVPLALVGIVPCKVSAENGPIRPGDLLVTSWTPGHAMRDDDPRPGTILGKAMDELTHGTAVIDVLVTLQ